MGGASASKPMRINRMNVINQVFPEVMCQQKRLIKAPFSQARVVQGNEDYGIILFQPVVVLKVKR